MFVSGVLNDRIVQYDLSTGYDLSTISEGDQLTGAKIANPYSLRFNNDGTKMFFIAGVSSTIREFSLGTAFDITTASADDSSDTVDASLSDGTSSGFAFNQDGTKLFAADNVNNQIDAVSYTHLTLPTKRIV